MYDPNAPVFAGLIPAIAPENGYLSGDIVKRIYHDQQSNGANIRWFETYARDAQQKMSGGEHAWDLISDNDQAIATGLYLFSVKDVSNGNIKTGKFLVIK